jgi:hypothetical protein
MAEALDKSQPAQAPDSIPLLIQKELASPKAQKQSQLITKRSTHFHYSKRVITFDSKTVLPTPNGVAKQCSRVIPSSTV